jgi:glycosyltransferase involved in cell wall biosynthesis
MYSESSYKGINIARTVHQINTSGITIVKCYWYKNIEPMIKECSDPILLANSPEEYDFFEANTEYDVLYANHNAFINEDRFVIKPEVVKKYDMVLSACFRNYKNVKFAENIKNTVHVGYKNGANLEYIPSFGTLVNFPPNSTNMKDYRRINTKELVQIYNSAQCGGIFSKLEGACYSSGEYLLCGLPVISTKCVGGREIYYTPENSIICNPDKKSVIAAHNEFVRNRHLFDSNKIRESTLTIMEGFRNTLTDFVKDKLEDKYNLSVNRPELYDLLKHNDNSNQW